MKTFLITYSDESMSTSRMHCVGSALSKGGIDDPRSYTPFTINGHACGLTELHDLYDNHKGIFDSLRGCGYWAWKPAIIYYYGLQYPWQFGINEGDVIVYADAGIEFINNVSPIIERMDQDIFLFGNNWEHAHWCKRDVVDEVWLGTEACKRCNGSGEVEGYGGNLIYCGYCAGGGKSPLFGDATWSRFGKQVQASVIFFRVSDYTRAFVAEWLKWCLFEGGRLIDDSPSRLPNHPEFREHRHDQAILTTLAYREGIKLHWWGARYNMDHPGGGFVYDKLPEYAADDYEPFVHHHRKRDHEWKA